ncbi:PrgI family protein [Phytohabitans sp. LJ34]|uniref:PrgI family protein n=1 Tax=Phytohabitans sp. LJ34 TaxID=3452217 RepID=UPI003F8B5F97
MSEPEIRAKIHADVEAPDKILYGLTARQVTILAAAALAAYLIWRVGAGWLPTPVLAGALIPLTAAAAVLALGRRDGLSFDRWLLAALRAARAPRRLVPAATEVTAPPRWAPAGTNPAADPAPAVLRLPTNGITEAGAIDLGGNTYAALVAVSTVNIGLRTGEEQAAMLGGFARWLHALSGPTQIVVSTRRVDLAAHADRVLDAAQALPNPALHDAACDYAGFLLDLAEHRDPLWRTVTIAHTATGRHADIEAMRQAEHTAGALSALGAATRVLDGGTVTGVLAAATDPYAGVDPHPGRARPDQPVTTNGWRP